MKQEEKINQLGKNSAARFNAGKIQWSLVDWDCMECMIEPYETHRHIDWAVTDLVDNIFNNLTKILSGYDMCKTTDLCGDTLALCTIYSTINRTINNVVYIEPNDNHPPAWGIINFKGIEPMVRVLEYGAKKYDRHNWRKGQLVTELCDSAMRHAIALMSGEEEDPESGLPHIGHVMCNMMFIKYNLKYLRIQYDNRYLDGNKAALTPVVDNYDKWHASVDPVNASSKVEIFKKD